MENRLIKILAIDDIQDNLIILKALIKESFPEVIIITALSGQKGIDLAITEDPDVILLDIVMPEMDGFEVCRRLKANRELSEIPVVFVTANKGDKTSRIIALECGAEAFLTKPIDKCELIAQIRAMMKIREANLQKRDENERLMALVEEKTYQLKKAHSTTMNLLEDLKKENEARKESQIALIKSEEKYRRIAENISDVVWTGDLNLNATYVSPSIERLLHKSVQEYINSSVEEKFTQESINRIRTVLLEELEKEKDPTNNKNRTRLLEVEHYMADGTTIWVSIHVSFLRDKDENVIGIQGVTRDISERKKAEKALLSSELRYRRLFEAAKDGILIIDVETGKIMDANPLLLEMLGYPKEQILQSTIWELELFKSIITSSDNFLELHQNGYTHYDNIALIAADGRLISVEFISNIYVVDKQKVIQCNIRDNTDRKKAENELRYLSYHDQLTGVFNRRFFEEELMKLDIKANLPISIAMGDINGLKLINDSFGHALGDELLKKAADIMKNGCRKGDMVARLGGDEFVIILPKTDSVEAAEILNNIKDLASHVKVSNIDLSISFGFDTKVTEHQATSEVLVNAENHMYRHKLYERSSMRSKTIDIIMNTLFEKSNRESLHSKRVSELCEAIAIKLNLETDDINQIIIAGLVHDIGKIGVDEKILNKAGRLDEYERNEIEKHPETGWRILCSTNEFSELAQFILEHHEKWDGQGYPNGLKGDEISIVARIITIADSFDAMTRDRSYRKGLSEEEAINEIKRCSGSQFDPNIAKVFIEKVLEKDWN